MEPSGLGIDAQEYLLIAVIVIASGVIFGVLGVCLMALMAPHRRLHGEIGLVPPVEFENAHHTHDPAPTTVGASVRSLHQTRAGHRAPPHSTMPPCSGRAYHRSVRL